MDEADNDPDSEIEDSAPGVFKFEVTDDLVGARIDSVVASAIERISRAEVQRLIERPADDIDGLRVNDKRVKSNYKLRMGDLVTVVIPAHTATHLIPEQIPLDILFEDSQLLVINKARGMVVHPAPGSPAGTLANAVLGHTSAKGFSVAGDINRPGIVHRLDKDTGGLIMVAKTDAALRSLQQQIQSRSVARRYKAILWGNPGFRTATIEAPIGRHLTDRKKMAVITDMGHTARPAVTELTEETNFGGDFTLCEAKLQTGRTHQIRVHCAYIQHPIVGDAVYGGNRKLPKEILSKPDGTNLAEAIEGLNGQALHAYSLAFDHPVTKERLSFTCDLAPQMNALLNVLKRIYGEGLVQQPR